MSSETQTFDPHGDVVLVLNRHQEASPIAPTTLTREGIASGSDGLRPISVNMLVSSKHMILASSVFAAMLKVDYKEGSTLESKGKVEILLPDDEPDVFTILLNIIHGRTKKVPRRIDLVSLTKLSILVDKYQMHEAVGVFAEIWIEALKVDLPQDLTEDVLFWLCISWVFGDGIIFQKVTEILMRMSDSEFDEDAMNELPIPEAIIERIQYERRQGAIANLLLELQQLLSSYHSTGNACNRGDGNKSACDAMVLGSILKATQKARLWPFPEPPYKGFTVDGLKNDILAIEIKTLCDITNPEHGLNTHKGLPPDRRPRSGFFDDDDNSPPRRPYSPRRPISPPRSPLMSRRLRQANRYEPDDKYRLKASQAIKGSITKTINTLSDKLCGLKIEDFK